MTKMNMKWLRDITSKTVTMVFIAIVFSQSNSNLLAQANSNENAKLDSTVNHINVVPKRCVALRKGQVCYQKVSFQWKTESPDDYCLFSAESKQPLHCWQQQSTGKFTLDFQSTETIIYNLRQTTSNANVAETEVTATWVYSNKKRKRSSWRLF